MKNDILEKLKELHALLGDKIGTEYDCMILGEHDKESNIVGSTASYLNLINCITKMLLVNEHVLEQNDKLGFENGELYSSEIKHAISDYSDYWPVCMIVQSEEKFAETFTKQQYDLARGL